MGDRLDELLEFATNLSVGGPFVKSTAHLEEE
jgi:hypothetical protein